MANKVVAQSLLNWANGLYTPQTLTNELKEEIIDTIETALNINLTEKELSELEYGNDDSEQHLGI